MGHSLNVPALFCRPGPARPEDSRFFGMVVAMDYYDQAPPHFQVRCGKQKAVMGIEPVARISRQNALTTDFPDNTDEMQFG